MIWKIQEVELDIVFQKKETINMEDNSKYTAIKRDKRSFPLSILLKNNSIKGKVLDFGCGHGVDADFLSEKEYDIERYDPNFSPKYPNGKLFDTIICFYVLNVLEKAKEREVLAQISSLLSPEGRAYFAVRRDLNKEGKRFHVKHKKYTYQRNVYLDQKSVFKNKNCEIYEMEHFTVKNKSNYEVNPFLSGSDYRIPFAESKHFFTFYSKYPQSKFHMILTYKKNLKDPSDFLEEEREELKFFTSFCINLMKDKFELNEIDVQESTVNNRLIKSNQWHLQLIG